MFNNFTTSYKELFKKACNKENFINLKQLILSNDNITLAVNTIKKSINLKTIGIDNLSIIDLLQYPIEDIINRLRQLSQVNYITKPVIAKQIINKNGQIQYIGIPTIWDRLFQQCILQIIEPICIAHFYKRNYSYKPQCTIDNVISIVYNRLQLNKIYNILEIDIHDFHNHVNHSKLIKQLWTLGIHDKWLIYQLKTILLTPIIYNKKIIHSKCGLIQSGILQSLLLNIALNEFDHWIASQWEENIIINNYTNTLNKNGVMNKGSSYAAMRRTKLKEMYLVRYNDNILIFVKQKQDILNIQLAINKWFYKRLKYQLNLSNIKVINTTKQYFNFLGFKIKTVLNHKKYVVQSHINDYQLKIILSKLKKCIIDIQHASRQNIFNTIKKFNEIIFNTHLYYRFATHINNDCSKLDRIIHKLIFNRLQGLKRQGRKLTILEKKYYGKSKMLRYFNNEPLYPIGYVQHKHPIGYRESNFDVLKK